MIYQRETGAPFTLDVRWRGYKRIQVSTGTTKKALAQAMERTVKSLRDAGRKDILGLIADRKLLLADVHQDWLRNKDALEQRIAKVESPAIGELLDEWFEWLRSPATLSPRSKRPFASRTVDRYEQSWSRLLVAMPNGRQAVLTDITKGFVADFRKERIKAGTMPGTVNRDLTAVESFLRWVQDEKGIAVSRFPLVKEAEPDGRERWLNASELTQLREATEPRWWPLFYLLVQTGMRIGEAQGLVWSDVQLAAGTISINDRRRRLKTKSSSRLVPISEDLARVLLAHRESIPHEPLDPVFPEVLGDYRAARRAFARSTKHAKLHDVVIHDLRHTFGVHCAQAGVPMSRIQKLLGHSSPAMTMRYVKHAPESYFAEDAARIAGSLKGTPETDEGRGPAVAQRLRVIG